MEDRLISGRTVTELTSYSKSSRRRMMKRGEFPRPIIEQPNDCRWSYQEVMQWVEARKREALERREKRPA